MLCLPCPFVSSDTNRHRMVRSGLAKRTQLLSGPLMAGAAGATLSATDQRGGSTVSGSRDRDLLCPRERGNISVDEEKAGRKGTWPKLRVGEGDLRARTSHLYPLCLD